MGGSAPGLLGRLPELLHVTLWRPRVLCGTAAANILTGCGCRTSRRPRLSWPLKCAPCNPTSGDWRPASAGRAWSGGDDIVAEQPAALGARQLDPALQRSHIAAHQFGDRHRGQRWRDSRITTRRRATRWRPCSRRTTSQPAGQAGWRLPLWGRILAASWVVGVWEFPTAHEAALCSDPHSTRASPAQLVVNPLRVFTGAAASRVG